MFRLATIAMAGAVCLALPANAAEMIHNDGMTGAEVVSWLQKGGYKAELTTDSSGDPKVKSSAEGVNFSVYFYDCDDKGQKSRCKALQFAASFDLKSPLSAGKVNDWNREYRYLKAYIDDEGDPFVEYDVNVNGGRSLDALDDDFGVWTSVLDDFLEFIDW